MLQHYTAIAATVAYKAAAIQANVMHHSA